MYAQRATNYGDAAGAMPARRRAPSSVACSRTRDSTLRDQPRSLPTQNPCNRCPATIGMRHWSSGHGKESPWDWTIKRMSMTILQTPLPSTRDWELLPRRLKKTATRLLREMRTQSYGRRCPLPAIATSVHWPCSLALNDTKSKALMTVTAKRSAPTTESRTQSRPSRGHDSRLCRLCI